MSRFASQAKAGYYPLPPSVTQQIIAHFDAPHGGRLIDPCAGKGAALKAMALALGLEPYGCEIDAHRARAAADALRALPARALPLRDPHLTRIVHGDLQRLVATPRSAALLYVNPPYDYDRDDGRTEVTFLRAATQWVQPDGWLVFVVPQHIPTRRKIARYLVSHYEPIHVYRFPDGEYARFKQIVIFGRKRPRQVAAAGERVEALIQAGRLGAALEPLPARTAPVFRLPAPAVASARFTFRSEIVDRADALAEARALGVWSSDAWRAHTDPGRRKSLAGFRPLMPLKRGHLAGLIAAGFINNLVVRDGDGRPLLVRGSSTKDIREKRTERGTDDDGNRVVEVTQREYVKTTITTLNAAGALTAVQGADLEAFLRTHAHTLAQLIARHNAPLYDLQFNALSRRIGQRGSLFPVQKHVATAVALRLQRHRDALMVGEMGTGKTRTAAAVIAMLDARRSLVVCPPHLVQKWLRELRLVHPDAQVTFVDTIGDVEAWMGRDEQAQRQIGVMKMTSMRAGPGWRHAYAHWAYFTPEETELIRAHEQARAAGNTPDPLPDSLRRKLGDGLRRWETYQRQARGIRYPTSGQPILDRHGTPQRPERLEKSRQATGRMVTSDGRAFYDAAYQFVRGRTYPEGSFGEYARREAQVRAGRVRKYEPPKGGRWPLATYIKQRYKGRLHLLICDEAHKLKGRDTDQGYAFHRLAVAARKVLALTGTLYGGKASSLFHLLYRMCPDLAAAYTRTHARGRRRVNLSRWLADYGLVEITETVRSDPVTGKTTANKRDRRRVKEAPGSDPHMLRWLLDRCAFMSMRDLGFALPPYREIPVAVEPTPGMLAQLDELDHSLGALMRERVAKGDKSLLGAYLQAGLCLPDAPFRDEVVVDPKTRDQEQKTVVANIKGLPAENIYPKEEAVIARCQAEIAAGRKVLLLCQQTATRDITGRWVRLLTQAGLAPAVMRASAATREKWLAGVLAQGKNVIISHPRAVETGLDIVEAPTIIWMGTEYSVYTLLQASRRSWRIGQTKPVKVYFYYYSGTLQEKALELIVRKVAAAIRVNGDVIAHDSLADLDDNGSIEDALGRAIVDDTAGSVGDLGALFSEANAALQQADAFMGEVQMEMEAEAPLPDLLTQAAWMMPLVEALCADIGRERDPYRARQRINPGPNARAALRARVLGRLPEATACTEAQFEAVRRAVWLACVAAGAQALKLESPAAYREFFIEEVRARPERYAARLLGAGKPEPEPQATAPVVEASEPVEAGSMTEQEPDPTAEPAAIQAEPAQLEEQLQTLRDHNHTLCQFLAAIFYKDEETFERYLAQARDGRLVDQPDAPEKLARFAAELIEPIARKHRQTTRSYYDAVEDLHKAEAELAERRDALRTQRDELQPAQSQPKTRPKKKRKQRKKSGLVARPQRRGTTEGEIQRALQQGRLVFGYTPTSSD